MPHDLKRIGENKCKGECQCKKTKEKGTEEVDSTLNKDEVEDNFVNPNLYTPKKIFN